MTKPLLITDLLMDAQAEVLREDALKEQEDNEGLVECDYCGKMRPEEEVHEVYDVRLNPYLKCDYCIEDDC